MEHMPEFYLERSADVSGVSGEGVVARGVILPSGRVVLEWLRTPKNIELLSSPGAVEKTHGHEGKTKVVFF